MIAYAAIGILLLALLLVLARWIVTTSPRRLAQVVRILAVVIGLAVAIYLLVVGRAAIASLVFGGLLPLLVRWRSIVRAMRNASGPAPGQQSEVATRYVRMRLDHDTGTMSGTVLDGPDRGRTLHELSREALIRLLRTCRVEDPQGASLLETYLDRTDPAWRDGDPEDGAYSAGHGGSASSVQAEMTRDEAYRILGLEPGADEEAIKRAHRALMQKVHPDRGGSAYLAAKINAAKDLLLRT